ncbi:hypothetical protein ACFWY9_44860, partial [Amycolatopsis sp. NPDC059027]|uniref:hypothetical protein n=1 Tax=Amycolatopsis sp. NPDC059027 TaxID=3346709 RepID=UPI00366BF915
MVPEIGPHNVHGYIPLADLGSTPMDGEPLNPDLEVGAPGRGLVNRMLGRHRNSAETSAPGSRAGASREQAQPQVEAAIKQLVAALIPIVRRAAENDAPLPLNLLADEGLDGVPANLRRETARKAISAAIVATVRERASVYPDQPPFTAAELARDFAVMEVVAEYEIKAAAMAEISTTDGPHSPENLGRRYGKSRRWASDLIGEQVRADAESGRFTTAQMAERHGISAKTVEFHLRPENAPDHLAAVRAVRNRILTLGVGRTGDLSLGQDPHLRESLGQDSHLREVMARTGLSRERALFDVGAVLVDALVSGRVPSEVSVDAIVKDVGIDAGEVGVLIDTAAELTAMDWPKHVDPITPDVLGKMYGKDSDWGIKRIETAIVGFMLREGAAGRRHLGVHLHSGLGGQFGAVPPERVSELVAEAVRADVLAGVGRGEPFTVAELAAKYGMTEAWCADQLSVVMQDLVRGGSPRGVEGLAVEFGVDVAVAEEAVVAVVLGEVWAARGRGELVDVASVARRYGVGLEVVDRRIDAVMRADVRDAAIRRDPYTVARLAAKYGVDESRALAQIELVAIGYLQDSAKDLWMEYRIKNWLSRSALADDEVVERFGQTLGWARRMKHKAAILGTSRMYPAKSMSLYFGIDTRIAELLEGAPRNRLTTARVEAWDALGQGEWTSPEKLAERYGIDLEDARDQVARVAREYLREMRDSVELPFEPGPHNPEVPATGSFQLGRVVLDSDTAEDLVARLGIGDGDAEALDTDTESVLDDEDFAKKLVRDVRNEPLDADTEFVLDGQDYIANLEEGRVGLAARLAG